MRMSESQSLLCLAGFPRAMKPRPSCAPMVCIGPGVSDRVALQSFENIPTTPDTPLVAPASHTAPVVSGLVAVWLSADRTEFYDHTATRTGAVKL